VSLSYAAVLRLLGKPFARLGLRLRSIEFRRPEILAGAWREFQEGRSRLVIAFRHAYGDEPQLLSLAFAGALRTEARRLGSALPRIPRARFVHGYEVPLWSGAVTRWILPRSGAMPVYHAKVDRPSLERMRAALRDGPYPLALAPEGQISYRSETLPRIEEGAVRLGIWCAEELAAAGRSERVLVLPLSVHYRHDESDAPKLEALVADIEESCGMPAVPAGPAGPARPAPGGPGWKAGLAARIAAVEARLIATAEEYYGIRPAEGASRDERMDEVLEEALGRAEAAFGLAAEGDRIARVYRIRQEGWDRIYPEGGLKSLTGLGRRLADRRAGEAWYVMRHMELVDLGHYLDSKYLEARNGDGPPFDRLVEAAYSAADLASRLVGGDISHRPSILAKRAVIAASPPIDMGALLAAAAGDRRAAARAALAELEGAYLREIKEYIDERIER
jgi:hypothetical protein